MTPTPEVGEQIKIKKMGTVTPMRPADLPGPSEEDRFNWGLPEAPTKKPAAKKKRRRPGAKKFEGWCKDRKETIWHGNKNKKVNYHFGRFPNLGGGPEGRPEGVRISYIGAAGASRETRGGQNFLYRGSGGKQGDQRGSEFPI